MADISPEEFFGEIMNTGIVLLLFASPIIIGFIIYIIYQNFGGIMDYITSIDEKMPAWMDEPLPDWTGIIFIGIIVYAFIKKQDDEEVKKK